VTDARKPANPNDFQIALDGLEATSPDGIIELLVRFRALAATA
jgi:hypothetical protein